MNPELRELLGKVAYQAAVKGDDIDLAAIEWDDLSDHAKELYRSIAEDVALTLAEVTLQALQSLTFAFTGKQIELHFEENT